MEPWLDFIDEPTLRRAIAANICFGVTTNPDILGSVNKAPSEILKNILELLPEHCPVAVQVTKHDDEEFMYQQAKQIVTLDEQRIVIKVPVTEAGLRVMVRLHADGIRVMATAIVCAEDYEKVALAGVAEYAAPYLHKMEERKIDYLAHLRMIMEISNRYNNPPKTIAASIDTVDKILECEKLKVQAITIPKDTFISFLETTHPLALECLNNFSKTWEHNPHCVNDPLFTVTEKKKEEHIAKKPRGSLTSSTSAYFSPPSPSSPQRTPITSSPIQSTTTATSGSANLPIIEVDVNSSPGLTSNSPGGESQR